MGWISPVTTYDFCSDETGYEITKSYDNDTGTYWWHDYSEYHWAEYDMGSSKDFTKIRLYQHSTGQLRFGAGVGVKVWISDDPESWGDIVYEGDLSGSSGWNESTSFSATGRYIRIESKIDEGGNTLYEFEAWDVTGPTQYFKTITGKSSIRAPLQQEITAKSRIKIGNTQTINSEAYLHFEFAKTITGDAKTKPSRQINGNARTRVPPFGEEEEEGSPNLITENQMRGTSFTCPITGRIKSMSVYVENTGTDGGYGIMKAAIYEHDTGNKIGQTVEDSFGPSGPEWRTLNMVGFPIVDKDIDYVLVIWAFHQEYPDWKVYIRGVSGGAGHKKALVYTGNFPDNISDFTEENMKYSIYATYKVIIEDFEQTVTGIARIKDVPFSKMIGGNARIKAKLTKLYTGKGKIRIIGDSPTSTIQEASVVTSTSAILNTSINFGQGYDYVWSRFGHREKYTDEGWSLSEFTAPDSPDITGDWENRTPVKIIAAFDSSEGDKAIADYTCDGTQDDVQFGLAQTALSTGGLIRVCKGHYYFDPPFEEPWTISQSSLSIVGDDRDLTIIQQGGFGPLMVKRTEMPYLEEILVQDLSLRGHPLREGEGNGIWVQRPFVRSVVINNLDIRNFAALGVYIEKRPSDIWIKNCQVFDCGNHGIGIAPSWDYEGVNVLNNTVVRGGIGSPQYGAGHGISFWAVRGSTIANNVVINSGSAGIAIHDYGPSAHLGSKDVLVQGNLIKGSGHINSNSEGIQIAGSSQRAENITIKGNLIEGDNTNAPYGIYFLDQVYDCTIESNNLLHVPEPLYLGKGTGHTLSDNVGLITYHPWRKKLLGETTLSEEITGLTPSKVYEYKSQVWYR